MSIRILGFCNGVPKILRVAMLLTQGNADEYKRIIWNAFLKGPHARFWVSDRFFGERPKKEGAGQGVAPRFVFLLRSWYPFWLLEREATSDV